MYRNLHRLALATSTVAAVLALGSSVGASAAPPPTPRHAVTGSSTAARSVDVQVMNGTGCRLTRDGYYLAHGNWDVVPPETIAKYQWGTWSSESNFMRGTEGWVWYITTNCDQYLLNHRFVRIYWDNPYWGSNSYDTDCTDSLFPSLIIGGGGNNAVVDFLIY